MKRKDENERAKIQIGMIGNLVSVASLNPEKSFELSAGLLGIDLSKGGVTGEVEEWMVPDSPEDYKNKLEMVKKDVAEWERQRHLLGKNT